MSIKLRLLLLTGTSVLAVLLISLVSYLSNARTEAAMIDSEVSMIALSNHLEADMMHDALRADVLLAMLVGLGKSDTDRDQVVAGLAEHAAHFRKVLADNLALPLSQSLTSALEKIKPGLDAYIVAGERIVDLALNRPERAQQELAQFSSAFTRLEGEMSSLSELIESNSKASGESTRTATRNANFALGVVLVISMLLLTA